MAATKTKKKANAAAKKKSTSAPVSKRGSKADATPPSSRNPPSSRKPASSRTAKIAKLPKPKHMPPKGSIDRWELRLYVAGETPRSVEAFAHLKKLCDEMLEGRYTIEVIDLLKNPTLAAGDQIIAIPTLVRKLPTPMKRIIGDLSNRERVLVGLNLTPAKEARR